MVSVICVYIFIYQWIGHLCVSRPVLMKIMDFANNNAHRSEFHTLLTNNVIIFLYLNHKLNRNFIQSRVNIHTFILVRSGCEL